MLNSCSIGYSVPITVSLLATAPRLLLLALRTARMLRHASTSTYVPPLRSWCSTTRSSGCCLRNYATSPQSSGRPLHLVLLGAPGAGKGTQTDSLLRKFNLSSLVVGNLLREEVARKSDVGVRAAKVMKAGGLLDDATILEVIKPSLSRLDGKDWIIVSLFEGYLSLFVT